jgi:hypothetical protein
MKSMKRLYRYNQKGVEKLAELFGVQLAEKAS